VVCGDKPTVSNGPRKEQLMTILRIGIIVGLSLAWVRDGASQSTSPVQEKQPTVAASVRAERDALKTGAPIILKATLTNQSGHEITFAYDRSQGLFDVDVFDETGVIAPDKRPGYHNGRLDIEQLARTSTPEQLIKSGVLTGHLVWITLKPGEGFTETIDVSKYYDMAKPGTYKVIVQGADPETKNTMKSKAIEVKVSKLE
jgi:hypothetical protein